VEDRAAPGGKAPLGSSRDHQSAGSTAKQGSGKASPEAVIGNRRPKARLNKKLVLGVIAALVVVMLAINFLPSSAKGKGSKDSPSAVYGTDSMPQDVREMALKMPEAKAVQAGVPAGGSGQVGATRPDVFAGYSAGGSSSSQGSVVSSSSGKTTKDYQGMASSDAKLEAEEAARRAPMEVTTRLTAGLNTQEASTTSSTGATTGTASTSTSNPWGPTGNAALSTTQAASGLPASSTYTPGQIYRDFNDQASKVAFSQQQSSSASATVAQKADPALLPYTLFEGTIIAAALQTAINTDLPGEILATVTENVWDSVSGANLLIPQGSKLLASYSSSVSFGQKRVQVAWQRLIRPDGVSIELSNMNGVDPQGASGYPGWVDQHFWEYAKGIGLMALFSVIDGQLQYSMKSANSQGLTDIANSVTAGIDQVGTQFTSNVMNVQPTITVKQGVKVEVFVNRDLILPSAQQKKVSKPYVIP
jgi:type IV secretion system protein TrbI